MKMSDIFGYNYKMTYGIYTDARVDGMAMPANMGFGMLFTNEEAPKAVCYAVNNHDRLTEENAKLRKMLTQLQIEGGLGIARHRQIDRLLNQLEKGNERLC